MHFNYIVYFSHNSLIQVGLDKLRIIVFSFMVYFIVSFNVAWMKWTEANKAQHRKQLKRRSYKPNFLLFFDKIFRDKRNKILNSLQADNEVTDIFFGQIEL